MSCVPSPRALQHFRSVSQGVEGSWRQGGPGQHCKLQHFKGTKEHAPVQREEWEKGARLSLPQRWGGNGPIFSHPHRRFLLARNLTQCPEQWGRAQEWVTGGDRALQGSTGDPRCLMRRAAPSVLWGHRGRQLPHAPRCLPPPSLATVTGRAVQDS